MLLLDGSFWKVFVYLLDAQKDHHIGLVYLLLASPYGPPFVALFRPLRPRQASTCRYVTGIRVNTMLSDSTTDKEARSIYNDVQSKDHQPSADQNLKEICKVLEERTKAQTAANMEYALASFEVDRWGAVEMIKTLSLTLLLLHLHLR